MRKTSSYVLELFEFKIERIMGDEWKHSTSTPIYSSTLTPSTFSISSYFYQLTNSILSTKISQLLLRANFTVSHTQLQSTRQYNSTTVKKLGRYKRKSTKTPSLQYRHHLRVSRCRKKILENNLHLLNIKRTRILIHFELSSTAAKKKNPFPLDFTSQKLV